MQYVLPACTRYQRSANGHRSWFTTTTQSLTTTHIYAHCTPEEAVSEAASAACLSNYNGPGVQEAAGCVQLDRAKNMLISHRIGARHRTLVKHVYVASQDLASALIHSREGMTVHGHT